VIDPATEHLPATQGAVDNAYEERNRVVALLASIFPSRRCKTHIDGWDPTWFNCVFIDLPTGQASWHYHDREAHLFAHVREADATWDGHTTAEKYERVAECARRAATPEFEWLPLVAKDPA